MGTIDGPRTSDGKSAVVLATAKIHGLRSREWLGHLREINEFLRQCQEALGMTAACSGNVTLCPAVVPGKNPSERADQSSGKR